MTVRAFGFYVKSDGKVVGGIDSKYGAEILNGFLVAGVFSSLGGLRCYDVIHHCVQFDMMVEFAADL